MGYKVGDKIKIREWDDMKKEFGLDCWGNIKCRCTFTRNMKKYCGKTLEISKIETDGSYRVAESCLIFSDDMIENKMQNFKIKITNKKDGNAVLKKMGKEGIVWDIKYKKPTCGDLDSKFLNYNVVYLYVKNNLLTWGNLEETYITKKLREINLSEYLKRNKSEHVIIYRDGNSVIAKDRNTGKNAVAKCHPDDEFDFMVGAKLALERLSNLIEKPKYYSGRVVCTKSTCTFLTVGKIYEVKDGQFKDDVGNVRPLYNERIKSFEDFDKYFESSFIEIVE